MRTVISLLLLLAAGPACAEWAKLSENDSSVTYIDRSTLHVQGDIRRIEILNDLKWSRGNNVNSVMILMDYDCKYARRRPFSQTSYAGQMGTGKVMDSGLTRAEWNKTTRVMEDGRQVDFVCSL